ncbi:MAG: hypothetical protein QM661_11850 [Solimonas sp.]
MNRRLEGIIWTAGIVGASLVAILALFHAGAGRRTTPEELLDAIGPQPAEIVAFLHRPTVTILKPVRHRWRWSRLYIEQGEKIGNECRFSSHAPPRADEPLRRESLANDLRACQTLMIEGEPQPPAWLRRCRAWIDALRRGPVRQIRPHAEPPAHPPPATASSPGRPRRVLSAFPFSLPTL